MAEVISTYGLTISSLAILFYFDKTNGRPLYGTIAEMLKGPGKAVIQCELVPITFYLGIIMIIAGLFVDGIIGLLIYAVGGTIAFFSTLWIGCVKDDRLIMFDNKYPLKDAEVLHDGFVFKVQTVNGRFFVTRMYRGVRRLKEVIECLSKQET